MCEESGVCECVNGYVSVSAHSSCIGMLKEYLPSPITSVTITFLSLTLQGAAIYRLAWAELAQKNSRCGELEAADHNIVHRGTE